MWFVNDNFRKNPVKASSRPILPVYGRFPKIFPGRVYSARGAERLSAVADQGKGGHTMKDNRNQNKEQNQNQNQNQNQGQNTNQR